MEEEEVRGSIEVVIVEGSVEVDDEGSTEVETVEGSVEVDSLVEPVDVVPGSVEEAKVVISEVDVSVVGVSPFLMTILDRANPVPSILNLSA